MTQEKFKQIIEYIGECIKGSEFENHVFAVGGCVRDSYMGNEIKDIDLCIDLPDGGIKLAEFLHTKKYLTRPPVVSYLWYSNVQVQKVQPGRNRVCPDSW